MRIVLTADLHYNHARGKALAEEVIARINAAGGDVLVVAGDTAAADGDALEQCLSLFKWNGPKLVIAGNHELWTRDIDSYTLFKEQLPARVRALGWHWLEDAPFETNDFAIVGTVGWYDYSFAQASLGIPRRFYEAKISPGAAERFETLDHLFQSGDDILPIAREIFARWNDGKFIKLGRSDDAFLQERLDSLSNQLNALSRKRQIIAVTHHLPFRDLLPPSHSAQWDFAKAYLGSERLGQLLLAHPNITHAYCGHSHFPTATNVGGLQAINIGSGYRWKTFHQVDVD